MRNEEARYKAVQAQITQLTRDAANDRNPAASILRAQLVAEMLKRNEDAHTAHEARVGIVSALEHRIEQEMEADWRVVIHQWREEEQEAIAYMKHGTVAVPPKTESEGTR